MSKTIILSESAVDRLGLRLNHALYKMLRNGDTSLGNNPALPDNPLEFQYKTLKDGMKTAVEGMKSIGADMSDIDTVINELRHMIRKAMKLEEPNKPVLEKLCLNSILELFSVPDGVINLSCHLGSPKDKGVVVRIMPEDEDGYVFSDVDDSMLMSSEIAKRRMIDCLIMGGSYNLTEYIKKYWKEEIRNISEELLELYTKIDIYDRYLLYADNPELSDEQPMLNAYVAVNLGGDNERTKIDAVGIIFPYLLRETIRGFMELFSSHGLPDDNERAMSIIRKADFMVAEPWDMRLGIVLWDKFWHVEDFGSRSIPYYFKEVCSLDVDDFNMFVKEQMLQTKKSKKLMLDVMSKIHVDKEREKFIGRIHKKNLDRSVVNDGDMSIDDLDALDSDIISEADRHREGYWKERWAKQKAESENGGKPTADRHREGYWKERWAKQKAAKANENPSGETKPKKATNVKKDRHRPGYYHDYNQAHPERLNRGFTKGYKNGNVSDGIKDDRIWLNKTLGIYIKGFDELGRPITNDPFGDLLRNKETEFHDDDWDEGSWDD